MKIGFDAKRLFLNHSGLGNYSRTLVQNLQTYFPQHDYQLYSPKVTEDYPFFKEQFDWHMAPSTSWSAYWRSFGIKQQLENNSIAIYHGLSNELPFGIHKTKLKSIVTIHDLIFRKLPQTYPFLDRKIYDFKFKKACQQADKIIAISDNTKQDIINDYHIAADKIEVVYQACLPIFYETNVLELENEIDLPKEFILTVGTLGPRKNLKLLLDAYEQLPSDLQLPIVVVAKGKIPASLKVQFQKLQQTNRLIWLNNINTPTQLKYIYQKATVAVYPSLYEGFGLPIVEALLTKTPVIAASNSSLMEAGGANTLYFETNAPEELAHLLQQVLVEEQLRQQLQVAGYAYAQSKFAPSKLSTQLIDMYQSLVQA